MDDYGEKDVGLMETDHQKQFSEINEKTIK